MGNIVLKGKDWKTIGAALESSFPMTEFDTFVEQQFPDIHRNVPWGQGQGYAVHKVVVAANARGTLDHVLSAASAERPFRVDLRALALHYARQPGWEAPLEVNDLDVRGALEELTTSTDPFLDASRLASWIIRAERQTCLVACGSAHGTGFLVGPDLVLTCHHVVKGHLSGSVPIDEVRVRFDYRRSPTGEELPAWDEGWEDLDPAWSIPSSPHSKADITLVGDPQQDELDFALLKLKKQLGRAVPPGEDRARGWVNLSKDPSIPAKSDPILISQHPERETKPPPQRTLQITCATPGFEGLNGNGTRVSYYPSTLKGSSGSPVFDRGFTAVALHHNRGQLSDQSVDLVKSNRGIPLAKIRAALTASVRALLIAPP